jgi:hypothetical protein
VFCFVTLIPRCALPKWNGPVSRLFLRHAVLRSADRPYESNGNLREVVVP